MDSTALPDRNWEFLVELLPTDWEELAKVSGAVKRHRGFKSVDSLLRTLLLHVGLGCSLRETSVVAKAAGWVQMSDVALLKKLRNSEGWLQALCAGLLRNNEMALPANHALHMRLIDGTLIKEPGQTGSAWRIHYSLRVPDWTCDAFSLSAAEGIGTAESLRQFDVSPDDCLIADRGYAHAAGILHVHQKGGYVIVRHNAQTLPLENADATAFVTLEALGTLRDSGQVDSWPAYVRTEGGLRVAVRLCAVRKSPEAILASQRKLRRRAQKKCQKLRPETLEYAQWIMVLTTVPSAQLSDIMVLEWYRIRWQIELAFKRLKSLAALGHLPKHDPASTRAWFYGKLLVALLTEKMQRYSKAFSPWGCRWCDQNDPTQSLAGE